ncbi:NAD kinase [Tersicoccus phoenicis]|uniref:NAD kinase n=1 Tax=Tersicoccus phoenicis TaxID=554083 RepID=A0A1R1L7B8_9MICC|nr:NAD kinase [Tersicoccus phoenicis]OMH23441.1 NAD kinase [Tersicoccus phoenicis]
MTRRILLLPHTGRPDAIDATVTAAQQLREAGLAAVLTRTDHDALADVGVTVDCSEILNEHVSLAEIELGMVLGGDGTILRSAELVRHSAVPLLGVNLGHVGFLAESDRTDLAESIRLVVERAYDIEERMTIDVVVWRDGRQVDHNWALNEASVEKSDRARMIEVVMEVDGRPISTFGCDGVVMATPTGSTAYAFSAGGPVVWPEVEALLMVPLSAHALFAKPLVVAPTSTLAVEVLDRTDASGVLWCDGRRATEVPTGSRIEVTRSATPVRLARTHPAPFSERLVRKFSLPTSGWRGPMVTHPGTGQVPVVLDPVAAAGDDASTAGAVPGAAADTSEAPR